MTAILCLESFGFFYNSEMESENISLSFSQQFDKNYYETLEINDYYVGISSKEGKSIWIIDIIHY